MMDNTIANLVKLPSTMPAICLEISQFRNCLPFLILVDFLLFSEKNSVGGDVNKDKDDNPSPH
jgi:hypothetical protein